MKQQTLGPLRPQGTTEDPKPAPHVFDVFGPPRTTSVMEARKMVADNLRDGIDCPCCGQLCKLYQRTINAAMARLLIWLAKAFQQERRWYSIHEFPLIQGRRGGGDFAKLTFWGLLEQAPKSDDQDTRTSGKWRPTGEGLLFAARQKLVPKNALIFNNQLAGFEGGTIDVCDALGKSFSWDELWNGEQG